MEINAIQLTFLDIPKELTQEYNRWYDLDHMPEHVAKGDVLMGRRYVSTKQLKDLPGAQVSETFGADAPYATIYFHGGPLDFESDEARALWTVLDKTIVKSGRYWLDGRAVNGTGWRLAASKARSSVLVSERAIPYVNHRGVIFAYGKAPSEDRYQEAIDWWDNTHLPDLFSVPGVLGAMRFTPGQRGEEGTLLHIILCEDSPAQVLAGIEDMKRYAGATGRWPAHKGAYEPLAFVPYDRIVALDYDFDFG